MQIANCQISENSSKIPGNSKLNAVVGQGKIDLIAVAQYFFSKPLDTYAALWKIKLQERFQHLFIKDAKSVLYFNATDIADNALEEAKIAVYVGIRDK